jgi:hypothetical protein
MANGTDGWEVGERNYEGVEKAYQVRDMVNKD